MAITDSFRARRLSPPLKGWTIAVLAGFGILHVVGGYMLHHAPGIRPIETATAAIDRATAEINRWAKPGK